MLDPMQAFFSQMPMIFTLLIMFFEMVYWALTILVAVWMVRDGNGRGINWMGFWATAFILMAVPNMLLPILPILPVSILMAYLVVRARYAPQSGSASPGAPQFQGVANGVPSRSIDPGETIKVRIKHWAEDAWLVKKSDPAVNQKIPIDQTITIIGRHPENTVAFLADLDSDVSRQQAKIEKINDNYVLTDLGSSNGTYVSSGGGKESRISKNSQHVLQNGDGIRFGSNTKVEFNKVS